MCKEQMKKFKVIFSRSIALELMDEWFVPVQVFKNPEYPKYNCYRFELTDNLQTALDRIFVERAVMQK